MGLVRMQRIWVWRGCSNSALLIIYTKFVFLTIIEKYPRDSNTLLISLLSSRNSYSRRYG